MKVITKIEYKRKHIEMIVLDQMVPEHHLVRKVERVVGFNEVHNMLSSYYCEQASGIGRPPTAPTEKFTKTSALCKYIVRVVLLPR